MNIARLIAYCRDNGIEFCLGNGTVRVRGAADIVEEMLPVLRTCKEDIIEYLSLEMMSLIDETTDDVLEETVCNGINAGIALLETRALLNRVMSRRM